MSCRVVHLPGGGKDVAVDLGHALGQFAADVDAPGRHRLAAINLHSAHRPVDETMLVGSRMASAFVLHTQSLTESLNCSGCSIAGGSSTLAQLSHNLGPWVPRQLIPRSLFPKYDQSLGIESIDKVILSRGCLRTQCRQLDLLGYQHLSEGSITDLACMFRYLSLVIKYKLGQNKDETIASRNTCEWSLISDQHRPTSDLLERWG